MKHSIIKIVQFLRIVKKNRIIFFRLTGDLALGVYLFSVHSVSNQQSLGMNWFSLGEAFEHCSLFTVSTTCLWSSEL